ncbi:winged helix-turn-helix transcriptional regulator [Lactococcus nasutitermitis]|uniref:Winged helix-turn-helix transcriptional regulator n=1 Tax=Lactococcus nasutitermitis TaxID=1652957 RepID=A0ABV9JHD4_9LACT|nr:helix-turn-helix domain-containing protein [Lactococcus nasutitermitis]
MQKICPARPVLDLLKGKYVIEILSEILADNNHFGSLLHNIPTINSRILSKRLREFEQEGLLERVILKANPPMSIEYQLTEKGLALRKVIEAMKNWQENY